MRIGLLSPGEMGQAVGLRLRRHGAVVRTSLDGRSARTRALAAEAGLDDAGTLPELVMDSEVLLSIIPPAQAVVLARAGAQAMRATGAHPLYVACHAVAPRAQRKTRPRQIPTVPRVAHRWNGQMEEMATTFTEPGLPPRILEGAAEMSRFAAASPLGAERPETRDRSRGMRETIAALARAATESVGQR